MSTLALLACGSDFDPGSRVVGARVLATRADLPFARPGEQVTLTTLAVDGRGRPFAIFWGSCDRPTSPTALGCVSALSAAPNAPLTALSPTASFTLTIAPDALAGTPPEARAGLFVGAVEVACPGQVELSSTFEGPPARCVGEDGEPLSLDDYDVAVKRVFLRERDRNQNPSIARVTFDGAPWPEGELREASACDSATTNRFDDCDGDEHSVALVPTPDSFEQGTDELGARYEEQLLVQYYAGEGLFDSSSRDGRNPSSSFKARAGARGRDLTLWFIVRDDRGGVAWTSRKLRVR